VRLRSPSADSPWFFPSRNGTHITRQQLKVQIKRLEMEKEILKQATVLMSEIPGKLSR
jgi:hypothetical protein